MNVLANGISFQVKCMSVHCQNLIYFCHRSFNNKHYAPVSASFHSYSSSVSSTSFFSCTVFAILPSSFTYLSHNLFTYLHFPGMHLPVVCIEDFIVRPFLFIYLIYFYFFFSYFFWGGGGGDLYRCLYMHVSIVNQY